MSKSRQSGSLVGARLGKYDLLALLALGGTAEIYLARIGGEAGFEKYVVVKCLLDHLAEDEEYVRMFLDEARLGAQLDHSNIVQTLELGKHEGRYYMVMEYLAGMSLAQLARKTMERVAGGLMPVDLALGLGSQVCAGLHYAHQRSSQDGTKLNIVHRDISPQNLVVHFDGVLKIVDFGIAKADVRQTHTRSGTIKGKFAYMSPEQCLAKNIDRRTDIFALGVILHELLTGRRLFKRSTTYETYQAIVSGGVPTPSQVNHRLDPSMDEVVMKALEYEREKRYVNAEEFGESLLKVLHKRGHSVSASDIRNYYEKHFGAELEEHSNRMRALVSGRKSQTTSTESMTWGGEDQFGQTGGDGQRSARPTAPQAGPRGSVAPPQASRGDTDDDDESAATRVELNPLEAIQRHRANQSGEIDTGEVGIEAETGVRSVQLPLGKPESPEQLGKATVNLGPSEAEQAANADGQQTRTLSPQLGGAPESATLSRVTDVPAPGGKLGAKRRPTADPGEAAHRRSLSGAADGARRPTNLGAGGPPPGAAQSPGGVSSPAQLHGAASTPRGPALRGALKPKRGNSNLPFGPAPAIATNHSAAAIPPISVPPDTLPGEDSIDEDAIAQADKKRANTDAPTTAESPPALSNPTQQGQGTVTPPAQPRVEPRGARPMPGPGSAPAISAEQPGGASAPAIHYPSAQPSGAAQPVPGEAVPTTPGGAPADRGKPVSSPPPVAAVAPAVDTPGTDEVAPIPLSGGIDDRALLAQEKSGAVPIWLIVAAFVASIGVGMVATLLIGRLL